MTLPGQGAARVRRQAAELLVRFLGGDISIVDEVCALRGLQEHLAAHAPEDPRRVFGEAVEGAAFQQVLEVLEKVTEKLITKIDEHFVAMERRVRPAPYAPVGGNTKALTIPQYLNEREREVPGFAAIRKRFAPSFNNLVSKFRREADHIHRARSPRSQRSLAALPCISRGHGCR